MDLYIGNLPLNLDDSGLKKVVETYAPVAKSKVILDKESNGSKGFGFVTILDEKAAHNVINRLNGQILGDKKVCVRKAYNKNYLPRKPFISKACREKAEYKI